MSRSSRKAWPDRKRHEDRKVRELILEKVVKDDHDRIIRETISNIGEPHPDEELSGPDVVNHKVW